MKLNQLSKSVFNFLFSNCTASGGYYKLSNDSDYMPVVVENIGKGLFSVAHYYEQNGDLCPDPDVVFHLSESGEITPMTFQNVFAYIESAEIHDGQVRIINGRKSRDLISFCNQWASNISYQQDIFSGSSDSESVEWAR